MDKEKLEAFKKQHPYKSGVVNSPWDEVVIDAEEVHKKPFEKIINAVSSVKSTKKSSIFVLQGEPGSGKSHLLWRIAKNTEKKQFLFVSITPYVTVNGVSFTTMLESTVDSLQKIHPALKSRPIDHIIGWTVKEGLKDYVPNREMKRYSFVFETILSSTKLPFVAKTTFETIPKESRKILVKSIKSNLIANNPKMPRYFFNLLIKMLEPETFPLVISFLKGEKLSPKELKSLELSGNFSLNEDVAYRILYSLFNFSPFPFIISIDQIETLDYHLSKNKIREFFEKIVRLFSNSGNVMFLLSVQTQTFKKWEKFLPAHITDRLSMKTTIYPITLEDAKAIVRKRNTFYWRQIGVNPKDPLYPFNEESLKEIYYAGNRNPRRLINALDYLLEKGTVKTAENQKLPDVFQRYVKIAETENLRYEIADLFVKVFGSKVLKKTTTYFAVTVNDTVFALNNSRYSVYSCVKFLAKTLKKQNFSGAILLRENKLKIRNSAVKTLYLIKKYNIYVHYYDKATAKNVVAIAKLLRDTESGDTELGIQEVRKFAAGKLKELLPFVFKKSPLKETRVKTDKNKDIEKIKRFISKITVTTRTKVIRNTGVSPNETDAVLKKLEKDGKIRLMKRNSEVWIFKNET